MTNSVFHQATVYLEKRGREAFLPSAGQRSRAIVPGDDPGDQQPPERRGLYPDPHAVATNVGLLQRAIARRKKLRASRRDR
jgi:hypothetical protein